MGVISALGTGLKTYWDALKAGRSGIRRITQFDASPFPCQIAGEVPDFDPSCYMERKDARRVPRSAQLAFAAARMAVEDAGLGSPLPEPERAGVAFGTAIGSLDQSELAIQTLRRDGYDRVSPFLIPSALPNTSAYLISQEFQALGPTSTISTACATGTQAMGEGLEMIRRGAADVMIVGGTDGCISDFAIGGFCAMRALPTSYNDAPERASRPFDKDREGFVYSEGAAVLILESHEHALARGARIYAELAGQASSSDGFHIAEPDPEAMGPSRAMRWALADAGVQPEEIDYINAHGTSTKLNDAAETLAIKNIFQNHAKKLAISSSKSLIGHLLAASGGPEFVFTTLSVHRDEVHPTLNLTHPDPKCDLDYVPNRGRSMTVRAALSNSFGFGGQNASIVVRKYQGGMQ
jgi:beta-ketoacyl-acyl-carrier-protein synthase II